MQPFVFDAAILLVAGVVTEGHTLHRAVENLASFCGIPITDAVIAATKNPAAEVGLAGDVGVIAPGARADMLFCNVDAINKKIRIDRVFVGGREVL